MITLSALLAGALAYSQNINFLDANFKDALLSQTGSKKDRYQ